MTCDSSEAGRRQDVHVSGLQLVWPRPLAPAVHSRDLHLGRRHRLSCWAVCQMRGLGLHDLHRGRLLSTAVRLQRKACCRTKQSGTIWESIVKNMQTLHDINESLQLTIFIIFSKHHCCFASLQRKWYLMNIAKVFSTWETEWSILCCYLNCLLCFENLKYKKSKNIQIGQSGQTLKQGQEHCMDQLLNCSTQNAVIQKRNGELQKPFSKTLPESVKTDSFKTRN